MSAYPVARHAARLAAVPARHPEDVPSLASMGFAKTNFDEIGDPGRHVGCPASDGVFPPIASAATPTAAIRRPSAARPTLSVHLRFGTISIRALARAAIARAKHAADARGGRDVAVGVDLARLLFADPPAPAGPRDRAPRSSRASTGSCEAGRSDGPIASSWPGATDGPAIRWSMPPWRRSTGSGFMHNRLRMVTASFLSKDPRRRLATRRGLLSPNASTISSSRPNNGGWQWASSSGCDAQPWFRIFNPITQSLRFDAEGAFIRRYVPALAKLSKRAIHAPWLASASELQRAGIVLGRDYPEPIVDHETARRETLARYAVVKAGAA